MVIFYYETINHTIVAPTIPTKPTIVSMPMVSGLSQLQLATLTIAIAAGGTAFSHVNDSGFWLSKSLFEVDEKTNLKTWTVMETIVGLVGIVGATIVWFIVS